MFSRVPNTWFGICNAGFHKKYSEHVEQKPASAMLARQHLVAVNQSINQSINQSYNQLLTHSTQSIDLLGIFM